MLPCLHAAIGSSKRNRNVRVGSARNRRSAFHGHRRLHAQQALYSLDLSGFEKNVALSFSTGLKKLDRDATSMKFQKVATTQAEPRIECRPTDAKTGTASAGVSGSSNTLRPSWTPTGGDTSVAALRGQRERLSIRGTTRSLRYDASHRPRMVRVLCRATGSLGIRWREMRTSKMRISWRKLPFGIKWTTADQDIC